MIQFSYRIKTQKWIASFITWPGSRQNGVYDCEKAYQTGKFKVWAKESNINR